MALKESIKSGFGFGLTSGIITTLGLIIGLHAGSHSKKVIIGGILTIAIADAFSDALGFHIAKESENRHTSKEIWEATISTLFSKFLVVVTFVVPILFFPLVEAIISSILWGISLVTVFSYYLAKIQDKRPWKVITEHLFITVVVIFLTHGVGVWIRSLFCKI